MRTMPPANAIAATFFGQAPESVTLIENRGSVNQVFLAQTHKKRVIVRLPKEEDKERAGAFYAKEAWCLAEADALGIPGPTVLALGKHDRWPYPGREENLHRGRWKIFRTQHRA